MRLLVCGGRKYSDADRVARVLDGLRPEMTFLMEGGATGADWFARRWAERAGVPHDTFEADWNDLVTPPVLLRQRQDGSYYNAMAGPVRNARMIREGKPDIVVAFPGNRGTADCVKQAAGSGIKVLMVGGEA